jgi:aspartate-semialdehyde dehydrogenase
MNTMKKIPVGILGATGMVGQHYLHLLRAHPWFEVTFLAASDASSGKKFREAVLGRWHHDTALLEQFGELHVHRFDEIPRAKKSCSFVFSAMTTEGAKVYEELYAQAGLPVISNACYHRMTSDIPLLIPEVNPEHAKIIPIQQKNRKWKRGFIAVKPNCSLQSYMIPLFPLHRHFQIEALILTSLQAISGAGHPGLSSLDILDNVIPHIADEEEKSEREPLKILGKLGNNQIKPASNIAISAHCNRVPVREGHLACVSVRFKQKPSREEILELWTHFCALPQEMILPSAPKRAIIYQHESDRPQPRLDKHQGGGMAVTVGRLRPCPVFDFRFVALSHNTIRGAAGGGILNAEFLLHQGYLEES